MIPGWKIKRELERLMNQIANIPVRLIEPMQRKAYDRKRWKVIRETQGDRPEATKVCIFLLYQPRALPQSVLETCDFLVNKGYALVILANGGLVAESVTALKSRAWRILERPNFGYDFGGFQDGVKFLNRQKLAPEHLIILNDSIWFPMFKGSAVIEDLQNSDTDVTGLLLHSPLRNDTPSSSVSEEKYRLSKSKRRRTEHIESYLIAVRRDIFSGEVFQGFWDSYTPSSSKHLTIKRGEIGFSKAMAVGGLSVGALSRRADFVRRISARDTAFLRRSLIYAAYSDNELQQERDALLAEPEQGDWQDRALAHIVRTVERRRFNASFCWATEHLFDTSFIKKNNGMLFRLSRAQFVRAVSSGELQIDAAAAMAEIRTMVDGEGVSRGRVAGEAVR